MEQLCISFCFFFCSEWKENTVALAPWESQKLPSGRTSPHLCRKYSFWQQRIFNLFWCRIWLRSRESAFWIIRLKHNVQEKFNWGRTFFLRTLIAYPPSSTYLPSLQMLIVAFELLPLRYEAVCYSDACFGWRLSCVTWTPCCGCQRTVICQGMISCRKW